MRAAKVGTVETIAKNGHVTERCEMGRVHFRRPRCLFETKWSEAMKRQLTAIALSAAVILGTSAAAFAQQGNGNAVGGGAAGGPNGTYSSTPHKGSNGNNTGSGMSSGTTSGGGMSSGTTNGGSR
jgi:hypothetical protein